MLEPILKVLFMAVFLAIFIGYNFSSKPVLVPRIAYDFSVWTSELAKLEDQAVAKQNISLMLSASLDDKLQDLVIELNSQNVDPDKFVRLVNLLARLNIFTWPRCDSPSSCSKIEIRGIDVEFVHSVRTDRLRSQNTGLVFLRLLKEYSLKVENN